MSQPKQITRHCPDYDRQCNFDQLTEGDLRTGERWESERCLVCGRPDEFEQKCLKAIQDGLGLDQEKATGSRTIF